MIKKLKLLFSEKKMDYLAFGISFLISFIVYFVTTAPSVTLEDSGELAVAGDYLGVPHPPGYPLWTLCAFIFTRIFRFVTYMGQPNPAWAIALMSGFFGALAAGITATLINKCAKELISHVYSNNGDENKKLSPRVLSITCLVSAISGSLAFAFSPVEWSQSTIIEVYTLNSFFLMLIFLFIFKWLCKPSMKLLWLVGFLFGLGFTNYQVLLFMALPMIVAVRLRDISLFRDFILLCIPIGLTIKMLELGSKYPEPGFAKIYPEMTSEVGAPLVSPEIINNLTPYYFGAVILGVAVCFLAILFSYGEQNKLNNDTKGIANHIVKFYKQNTAILAFVFVVLCFLLLSVAMLVKPIPEPEQFLNVPKSERFSFFVPCVLFAVGVLVLIALSFTYRGGYWYASAVAVTQLVLFIFIKKGCMLGLTHPLTGYFWFYIGLNVIYLLMAWLMLPNGKAVAGTVLLAELGAAFYGYMPLASEANPPMNWGFPKTWEGFKHAVTRGQYEKIVPITLSQVLSPNFVSQLGSYFSDLRMQFTLVLAPLGFIPFALWSIKIKGKRYSLFPIAFGLAVAIAILAVLDKLIEPTSANDLGGVYKYLMGLILLLATVGAVLIINRVQHLLLEDALNKEKNIGERIFSGVYLALIIAPVTLFIIYCISAIGSEYILESCYNISEPVVGVASTEEMSKYLKTSLSLTIAITIVLASLYALLSVFSYKKHDVISTNHSDISCKWFVVTMIAFIMMSVILIGMANPKGDIQDNFIQKVKFISSHAIFAIWIGYGIALSINLFRNMRVIWMPAVVICALLFIIPIRENYVNADMADITSAAEQNGHDFGWQFGNYQLRGADAIIEELSDDEEPLPNPEYPPEMTPNAIFFGGTDPGRFVPTYMIYSAKVRPDVFLITQNALADPTYLDTMRSLYADQIWMPTAIDYSNAFNEYIRLVQEGQLPNLGGISNQGGRIQVNGAMEVMEINALITKMIFDKNIAKHDFYVEESYAMRWMNPYLTPHGLIMKLNNKELSYPEFNASVQNDMDFWDWYTRRLTSNPAYERDVAARRSFSKLRASIAGLYATRRMIQPAERAFIEGIILYPYSPECTIRYMREVLFPYGRIDEAVLYVEKLVYKDVNNIQAQSALATLKDLQIADKTINSLREKNIKLLEEYNKANPNSQIKEEILILSDADMLQMVKSANVLGNMSVRFVAIRDYFNRKKIDNQVAASMLAEIVHFQGTDMQTYQLINKLPSDFFDNVNVDTLRICADIYMRVGNSRQAMNCLSNVLMKDPNDWRSWTSYSLLILQTTRNPQATIPYIEKAEKAALASNEKSEFLALINSVQELNWLYQQILKLKAEKQNNPFPIR